MGQGSKTLAGHGAEPYGLKGVEKMLELEQLKQELMPYAAKIKEMGNSL